MFYALAIAALCVLGLWWCYEVIRRLPQDLQEICQPKQISRTAAIVFVWVLTVIIAILLIRYGFRMIGELRALL